MANRFSIIYEDSETDWDGFIRELDFSWYYGGLFRTRKRASHDAANLINSLDVDTRKPHENGVEIPRQELNEEIILNFKDLGKNDEGLVIAGRDDCVANIFRILDEDGDGRVSTDEVMRFLERLNLEIPMDDLESTVKSESAGGFEFLTSIEFRDFYHKLIFVGKDENEEFVRSGDLEIDDRAICEAFGVFDQNGDGFISPLELSNVLCRLGFMEGKDLFYCHSMIENVDVNGDGFVDLPEFRVLITRWTSPLA